MSIASVYQNIRRVIRVLAMTPILYMVVAVGPHTLTGLRLEAERLEQTVVLRNRISPSTYSDHDAEIRSAIADKDAELASSLADLAAFYWHSMDPAPLAKIAEVRQNSAGDGPPLPVTIPPGDPHP